MKTMQEDESISNRLYHYFCHVDDDLKPKIKEIITIASKNLVDLTTCLILAHERITSERFKELDIMNRLGREIHKWHDDLVSGALATRRNISRLMSDIKYLIGKVPEGDELFLELDEIAKPVSENWTSRMSFKTGENLRKILLDLVLIVDPKISGTAKNCESDVSLITQRISEMTSSSKEFLSLHTFKTSFKEIKQDDMSMFKKDSEMELKVFSTTKKSRGRLDNRLGELRNMEKELLNKNKETLENLEQIKELNKLQYFHKIGQEEHSKSPEAQEEEDAYPICSIKNSQFVNTNLMEPETEISPVKINSSFLAKKAAHESTLDNSSTLTTKKNSVKKMIPMKKNERTASSILNKEITEPSFPNSKPASFYNSMDQSCKSSKKSIKSEMGERLNMVESIQSQMMDHPPTINTDRGPLSELHFSEAMNRQNKNFSSEHLEALKKSSKMTRESIRLEMKERRFGFNENVDIVNRNKEDDFDINNENINQSNFAYPKQDTPPKLDLARKSPSPKKTKMEAFQEQVKKARVEARVDHLSNSRSEKPKNFNFSNHTFQGNSPICSLGQLKKRSKYSIEVKDRSRDESILEVREEQHESNLKANLFSINTSQALSTIRDEAETFLQTNRTVSITHDESKSNVSNTSKSPKSRRNRTMDAGRDISPGFEGDCTPDKISFDGNNVFARSPMGTRRQSNANTRRKKGNFDIDRFMGDRNSEVIHVGIKGNQKIEVSADGKYAFFGGEGLNVLEMKNGEYRMIKKDKKKSKFP